jgi:hypothetical protein
VKEYVIAQAHYSSSTYYNDKSFVFGITFLSWLEASPYWSVVGTF